MKKFLSFLYLTSKISNVNYDWLIFFFSRHPGSILGGNPNGPPYGSMPRGMPNPMTPNGNMPGGGGAQTAPMVPNAGMPGARPSNNIQQDLAAQLAETIAQATTLIQAAGLSQG